MEEGRDKMMGVTMKVVDYEEKKIEFFLKQINHDENTLTEHTVGEIGSVNRE